jgi:indolepyruvate ferredoxin oxidoreductase beta subunit
LSSKSIDVIVAGVGGQGVILATEILGDAAMRAGLEVIIGETHGMAQRGGSVVSHVRMGHGIYSPTIVEGSADAILGFEPIETLRALKFANQETMIIMNSKPIAPITVSSGAYRYPPFNEVVEKCRTFTPHIAILDAFGIAEEAGSSVAANIVLLGALIATELVPVTEEVLVKTVTKHVPAEFRDVNLKAFEAGKIAFSSRQFVGKSPQA